MIREIEKAIFEDPLVSKKLTFMNFSEIHKEYDKLFPLPPLRTLKETKDVILNENDLRNVRETLNLLQKKYLI